MRIIGGYLKGRRFDPPAKKWPTRPTTDIAKEALFNMLQFELDYENLIALDLFGGTGNHCYELISRGAKHVTYVDKFAPAIQFVIRQSEKLEIADKMKIVKMDVFRYVEKTSHSYDYIFAGPPYPLKTLDDIPDHVLSHNILKEGGIFVLEHNQNHNFEAHPRFLKVRNYGQTHFSFFS